MNRPARPRPSGRSLAILLLGGVSLLAGLAGALVLLGIPMPGATGRLGASHGLLMSLGFLGTLIALERAVALGRAWGFLAPLLAGLAGVGAVVGLSGGLVGALMFAASLAYFAMYLAFDRIERALHTRVQAVAALAWMGGAGLTLGGMSASGVVPWIAAFLVLTIAGERLELSRVRRLSPRARAAFVAAAAILCAGVTLTLIAPDAGWRLGGLGLVALAAWLGTQDVARRTIRTPGFTRFVAMALLLGYGWLTIAGLCWVAFGSGPSLPAYDAMIHALFLGFVMSMVFGHAPVILPAVLRIALPYRPRFYLHLAVLHIGLVLRVMVGDLLGLEVAWRWGGVLNVVALLLFVGVSVATALGVGARTPRPLTASPEQPADGPGRQRQTDTASSWLGGTTAPRVPSTVPNHRPTERTWSP